MKRPTLYLIDGSGYIFRAYYAVRPLSTRAGVPTNAVLGFAKMLNRLIKERRPDHLGIAFDSKEKTFRHALYADYKANREAPPEDLVPQFPLIHELVEAMTIPRLQAPGYEADDILATLARQAVGEGYDVVIVSGDKDLMQLVSEHVTLFDPLKEKDYDVAAVIERFGVPPERVADVQALAGDTSDNIPGVPKVGLKTAAKLVAELGDVEQVIHGLEQRTKPKAIEQSVLEHRDKARLSKKLTVLAADAPVQLDWRGLAYGGPDPALLRRFFDEIEAVGLVREFGLDGSAQLKAAAAETPGDAPAAAPSSSPIDRDTYRCVLTEEQLAALREAAGRAPWLSVDLETTSLDAVRARLVGIALAVPGYGACYIPVAHSYLGVPKQLSKEAVLGALAPFLEDRRLPKVGQNLKYDMIVLAHEGVHLRGIGDDSMLAAFVLDSSRPSYGLDALAREALGHENIRYKDATTVGSKQVEFYQVDLDTATRYAAEDADVAARLCTLYAARIREQGLEHLYRDIELPLVSVLARMEQAGIRVDTTRLRRLGHELAERLLNIEARAEKLIGERINLGSTKQLAHVLFEKLKLPVVRKTKTGYSTDHEVLEALAEEHELPRVVLEHRELSKLKSTYIDALLRQADPATQRVHTSYNQTGAATGRLSSSDPNLQNIPIRTDDGRRIRECFIAEAGCVLISADYSQIELRVMAHLSGDPAFVEAFRQGEDVHTRTAREILTGGAPPTEAQRRHAKAINFGILYGLSEFGLAKQLGIPRAAAHDYIAAYFGRYPQIRAFLDHTIEAARTRGYVTTLAGRRRYLPNLTSKNGTVRQAAERIAMNTPIQGSAADIIKLAMLRVQAALDERRLGAKLLLQVHDELVLEAPAAERDDVSELVRREMANVMPLTVPLVVDVGYGDNWSAAH